MTMTMAGAQTPAAPQEKRIIRHPQGEAPKMKIVWTWELQYRVLKASNTEPQYIAVCLQDKKGTLHVFNFTSACPGGSFWSWERLPL